MIADCVTQERGSTETRQTEEKNVGPFLKWAGGKRWLVASGQLPIPSSYSRYIEPFLGGGAVFFHLMPEVALISDVNREIIELYESIKKDAAGFQAAMELHQSLHCVDYYYKVRASSPSTKLERAARTLYLNRTCWNGLYRVNKNGIFNVPIGTKNWVIDPAEDFRTIAKAIKRAELCCVDFEVAIARADRGDFLFVDPPYTVQHNMNGFVKYNENIFSWKDQLRLCDVLRRAAKRGVRLLMTNADHESVRALYADFCEYRSVTRTSKLAGTSVHRVPTSEAIFIANF